MATRGIIASKTVGDPFADRPDSWAKRAVRAIYGNARGRNREPADMFPGAPQRTHAALIPYHDFGFKAMATRANRPDLIVAATRSVPMAGTATRRGKVV